MNTETGHTLQPLSDQSRDSIPFPCQTDWQQVSSTLWQKLESVSQPLSRALNGLLCKGDFTSADGILHRRQADGSEKLEQPVRDSSDLPRVFEKLLKLAGRDPDGYLSRDDVDSALGDARYKGEDAQALVALKYNFDSLAALSSDGEGTESRITRADIAAFAASGKGSDPGQGGDVRALELTAAVDENMRQTRLTAEKIIHSLYADKQKPAESIKPEAVVQAGIGNCYFFGAMAALSATNPAAIERLLKDNGNGTYTVTFPGKRPITVDEPTDAEFVLYPKPAENGQWVAVLEKAYGKFCLDDPIYRSWRQLQGLKPSVIPQEHTDGGSAFDAGLRILTGERIGFTFNFQGKERLHEKLREAMVASPPRPVTADCSFNILSGKGAPVLRHTYSVLAYDADSRTITLRNPWGHTTPVLEGVKDLGNGKFSMKLDDFSARFTRIAYTRP